MYCTVHLRTCMSFRLEHAAPNRITLGRRPAQNDTRPRPPSLSTHVDCTYADEGLYSTWFSLISKVLQQQRPCGRCDAKGLVCLLLHRSFRMLEELQM